MPTFRRKPTYLHAEQFTADHTPEGVQFTRDEREPYVVTLHLARVPVKYGEWIVTESDGLHHYPIADGEFQRLHERVS